MSDTHEREKPLRRRHPEWQLTLCSRTVTDGGDLNDPWDTCSAAGFGTECPERESNPDVHRGLTGLSLGSAVHGLLLGLCHAR